MTTRGWSVAGTLVLGVVLPAMAGDPASGSRIVRPTGRTIPYGRTEVHVAAPRGARYRVFRQFGPELWQPLTATPVVQEREVQLAAVFDAGTNLARECVEIVGTEPGPEGARLVRQRICTDGFPRSDVRVVVPPSFEASIEGNEFLEAPAACLRPAPRTVVCPGATGPAAIEMLLRPDRPDVRCWQEDVRRGISLLGVPPPRASVPGSPLRVRCEAEDLVRPGSFALSIGGYPAEILAIDPLRRGGRAHVRLSLLFDMSDSMSGYHRGPDDLERILRDVVAALQAAPIDLAIRVVVFGNRSELLTAPRPGDTDPERLLGYVRTPREFEGAIEFNRNAIESFRTGLFTAYAQEVSFLRTLAAADRLAGARTGYAILLVTDCMGNDYGHEDDARVAADEGRIPTFLLVHSGLAPLAQGHPVCTSLPVRTGGAVVGAELLAAIVRVARTIAARYRVTFRMPAGIGRGELPAIELRPRPGVPLRVHAPSLWRRPRPLSVRARHALRGATTLASLRAVGESIGLVGSPADARMLLRGWRARVRELARRRKVRLPRDATLPGAERLLAPLPPDYRAGRAVVFRGIFRAIARGLLHGARGDQRAAAALAEEIHRYVGGGEGPYSLEHLLGPAMDTFLDPDFPADPRARETIARIHRPGEPNSRRGPVIRKKGPRGRRSGACSRGASGRAGPGRE